MFIWKAFYPDMLVIMFEISYFALFELLNKHFDIIYLQGEMIGIQMKSCYPIPFATKKCTLMLIVFSILFLPS